MGGVFFIKSADVLPIFSSGQVLQYETSSCFVDCKRTFQEYHERYLKIENGKTEMLKDLNKFSRTDESGVKKKKILDRTYGSFSIIKEDRIDAEEKNQENMLKSVSVLPKLVPSVSFNDKFITGSNANGSSQRRKSSVFRLSVKRTSIDGEEINEFCKCMKLKVKLQKFWCIQ